MILDVLQTIVGWVTVGAYAWALRAHFRSTEVPTGTKVISVAVSVTAIVYTALTWTVEQPELPVLLGLAIQLASLWLFRETLVASKAAALRLAFDKELPHSLVQQGPYRFVRHPFYVSYLVFWTGWALASWSWWSVPSLLLIYAIYIVAARGEEAKFARSDLSGSYAEYRSRTGMLFPRLGR